MGADIRLSFKTYYCNFGHPLNEYALDSAINSSFQYTYDEFAKALVQGMLSEQYLEVPGLFEVKNNAVGSNYQFVVDGCVIAQDCWTKGQVCLNRQIPMLNLSAVGPFCREVYKFVQDADKYAEVVNTNETAQTLLTGITNQIKNTEYYESHAEECDRAISKLYKIIRKCIP